MDSFSCCGRRFDGSFVNIFYMEKTQKTMKIIFLDFDGVLNSGPFIWSADKDDGRTIGHIDPKAVQLLNNLIKTTGAKVVVSSAWRILHTDEELQGFLNHHGFIGEIIGSTPRHTTLADGSYGVRGDQIQEWLTMCDKEVESFVIFDDDSDMSHLKHKFVQTKFMIGLTEEHIEAAIEILNEK